MTIRGHKISVGTFTSKKAGKAYGTLAFFYSINNGMFGAPNTLNANMPLGIKLQNFFLAIPVWRLTGSTFLANPATPLGGSSPPTFTFAKATNKLFWAGLAISIYGAVGMHFGLPYSSAALNTGPYIAAGAFIGGGFDPDPPGATPTAGLGPTMSLPAMSQAPGAGMPSQGSFSDAVRA